MSSNTPITIAVTKVLCIEETEEVDSDEPFVVVFVADVSRRITVPGQGNIIIPSAVTTVTGPWNDADAGEILKTFPIPSSIPRNKWEAFESAIRQVLRKPCWGLTGGLQHIRTPDDVIILVAMMEEDSRGHESLRGIVHAEMVAAVTGLINSKMTRAQMIAQLREDMDAAIDAGRKTSIPDFSEQIGRTQELRLTTKDLNAAAAGTHVMRLPFGAGGDDGRYRVRFELQNRSFLS